MKILSILKRYPATIISLILLISGITAIFIEGKVYAAGEKSNTPGCECNPIDMCPKEPPSDFTECDITTLGCDCRYGETYLLYCPTDTYIYECQGEKVGTGCSEPCESSDCPDCPTCGCLCTGSGCVLFRVGDKGRCSYPVCEICQITHFAIL